MTVRTKHTIFNTAKQLFARNGYEGFTMRTLAKASNVGLSSIYHFYNDKDVLLEEIYKTTNRHLGEQRALLPATSTASEMLRQRIEFQFTHIEDVIFVLKYYMHFRDTFAKIDNGVLPAKARLHIDEVVAFGIETGEITIAGNKADETAMVIAHAINGFLLEYYPLIPSQEQLNKVIDSLQEFIMRSLMSKEVVV